MPDRRPGTALNDGPPRALIAAAVVIAVAAVAAVIVIAALRSHAPQPPPLAVPAVPAPQAGSQPCAALVSALPEQLGDYRRAAPVEPVPPATAAWQSSKGGEPVIMRCGVEAPPEFVVGSSIQVVGPVQWFGSPDTATGAVTWFAVDRPVDIALTLPSGSGPTPIQVISDIVAATLPATPIRPGPAR